MSVFDRLFDALRRWFAPKQVQEENREPDSVPLEVPENVLPAQLLDEATREAARFLTENPLYAYRSKAGALNVVIVGESDLRSAFFSTVFSAAQMLDTRLQIHVLAPDAEDFCHRLVKKAPALPQVCNIFVNGERKSPAEPLIPQMLGQNAPLAHLYFRSTPDLPTAQEILALEPGCVLLMDDLMELAGELKALGGTKMLIGIAKDSLDPVILPETEAGQEVRIAPFIFTEEYTEDFYAQVEEIARTIHSFYTLEFNQRATKAEIEQGFRESYNFRSSLRSALAIPYKLYACGLAGEEDAAGKFTRQVLEAEDKTLLSRLVWLEHRSWQAFMIMEGWELLPEEDYATVLFANDNPRHQYKSGNRHPCLCASHDDGRHLPLTSWCDGDTAPEDLDPLDRCSVMIHQCFVDAAQDPNNPRYHTSSIENILRELADAVDDDLLPYVRELENVTHRVLNGDPGVDRLWKKLHEALSEKLEGKQKLLQKMSALSEKMDVRIRCLNPRDFKHSDLDVMEAIPMILQDHPVRHIYKLFSLNNWENVISAISIRPEKLVLVTEPGKPVDASEMNAYRRFLEGRGLDRDTVSQCSVDALTALPTDAVLDITGASAAQMHTAMENPQLRALPVIEYKNAQLRYLGSKDSNARLYRHSFALSVKDVLTVSGARVISDKEERHLLGMGEDAAELWAIAQHASNGERSYYNNFCTLLANFCMPDQKVFKEDIARKCAPCKLELSLREASGMEDVLSALEYCNRSTNKQGIHWVKAQNALWQGGYNAAVKAMERAVENNLNTRAFQLIKIPNPLYQPDSPQNSDNAPFVQLVRDNCLEHSVEFPINGTDAAIPNSGCITFRSTDDKYDISMNVSDVQSLMDALEAAGMLRRRSDGKAVCRIFSRNRKPFLALSFAFVSPAIRECLTKEGNVQEAFVYRVIREMDIFDDLKLSVSIAWDEQNKDATTNEIDLIGTKGERSYFISCKKRPELKAPQLTEIRYETDRFGIDGVPILITTAKPNSKSEACYHRAERMGVHIITLQDFLRSDGTVEDSAEILRMKLRRIVEES